MRPVTLRRDARGASLIEHLLLVGVVALLALAGYRVFAPSLQATVARSAICVSELAGCERAIDAVGEDGRRGAGEATGADADTGPASPSLTRQLGDAVAGTFTGAAKWAYNSVASTAGLINLPIDWALRKAGVSFQFGTPPLLETNSYERSAGYALDLVTIVGGVTGKSPWLAEKLGLTPPAPRLTRAVRVGPRAVAAETRRLDEALPEYERLGLSRAPVSPIVQTGVDAHAATIAAPLTASVRERFVQIMLEGSANLSRTAALGRRSRTTPASVADADIARIAEDNFREAAEFVVSNAHRAPLSRATAIEINRKVTRGLVDDAVRGDATFRRSSTEFYDWLGSPAAEELGRRDPVALAEQIHRSISGLDAFPDGNGRTARLMADLALIRYGRAPALYGSQAEYFAGGNARAEASIEQLAAYFREVAERGRRAASN